MDDITIKDAILNRIKNQNGNMQKNNLISPVDFKNLI